MTPEEALKIEAEIRAQRYDPRHYTTEFAAQQACMALADALRASQAQTVQMRTEALLKLRALGNDPHLDGDARFEAGVMATIVRAQKAIGSLPGPAAPAARTYEDGVRDAAKIAHRAADGLRGRDCCTPERRIAREIESLLSPAPAVAPVAQKHDPDKGCAGCEHFRDATSDAERYCGAASITLMFHDPDEYPAPEWCPKRAPVAAPKPGPTNVSVEIERLAARVAALESRLAAEEKA